LSSSQFTELIAYYQIELPEPYRSDWNFALVVKTLVDIYRKKGKKAIPLEECKLDFDTAPEDKETVLQRNMKRLLSFFHMHGIKKKEPEKE
jgi:hypothetical protein